jgi:predicted transcriptional regulator
MTKRARLQGELESLILDALWSAEASASADKDDISGALTSQQVLEIVSPAGELALTTILTVLSRLVDKELVTRKQGEGRQLLFSAAQSRERHTADLMLKIVAGADNPALAFSHFASGLSAADLKALRDSLA